MNNSYLPKLYLNMWGWIKHIWFVFYKDTLQIWHIESLSSLIPLNSEDFRNIQFVYAIIYL